MVTTALYRGAGELRQVFDWRGLARTMSRLWVALFLGLAVAACGGNDGPETEKPKVSEKPEKKKI